MQMIDLWWIGSFGLGDSQQRNTLSDSGRSRKVSLLLLWIQKGRMFNLFSCQMRRTEMFSGIHGNCACDHNVNR